MPRAGQFPAVVTAIRYRRAPTSTDTATINNTRQALGLLSMMLRHGGAAKPAFVA
jgi:hypothetical protein